LPQLLAGNILVSCSGYLAAFAIGMLASSAVAVILAWGCTVAGSMGLLTMVFLKPVYTATDDVYIGAAALVISIVVWAFGRNRSISVKWILAAVSGCVTLIVISCTGFVVMWTLSAVNGRIIVPGGSGFGHKFSKPIFQSSDPLCAVCIGKDGIAYRKSLRGDISAQVRVRTPNSDRLVVKASYAAPMAWLPDGDLLVGMSEFGRTMKLLEWDHLTGRTRMLAEFATSADHADQAPILAAVPNGDGSKIAILVLPNRDAGVDLWVFNRRTDRVRLIRPALDIDAYPSSKQRIVWRSDTIVFRAGIDTYCSIHSDGSHIAPVTRDQEGW
jgi:hypothetical protein